MIKCNDTARISGLRRGWNYVIALHRQQQGRKAGLTGGLRGWVRSKWRQTPKHYEISGGYTFSFTHFKSQYNL
jgi:hypothetical protein